ncbi:MAG: 50S ribosomal protein L17 [Candidatus Omnitrophica bacterium]|nr:50S ribosomal protein L17 [Candidatus Omnitrophota bacterium]
MRHNKRRTRLNRSTAHRKATLSMIAKSLFRHQSITTTLAKAKEARRLAEKLITVAKVDSVTSRRQVFSVLRDRETTLLLFKDISPLFSNRKGGYTRIVPKGFRRGDGAKLVLLELTEKVAEDKDTKPLKPSEKKAKKVPTLAKEERRTPKEQAPKPAPTIKPEVKEERVVEDVKREKAKQEEKRIKKKSFFKKFFQRRTQM